MILGLPNGLNGSNKSFMRSNLKKNKQRFPHIPSKKSDGGIPGDDSGYEIIFDGNDFYTVPPLPSGNFDIQFELYIASAPPDTEQFIFNYENVGNSERLRVSYFGGANEIAVQTEYIALYFDNLLLPEVYSRVILSKSGSLITLNVDGSIVSDTDATTDFTALTAVRQLSHSGAQPLRAGAKIKNMKGFLQWSTIPSGNVYQDAAKTTPVTLTGQEVAVIETPAGDIESDTPNAATVNIF